MLLSTGSFFNGTVGGGGGGGPWYVDFTIATGEVGADLSNFPVMVRLSDMPSAFWTHVKEDGGDIRVKTTGGSLIPMDLAWIDVDDQDGVLFFKASSVLTASDNTWRIHYGDPANNLLPYTDTNGRNNVWSAYTAVFLLGMETHDRTGGANLTMTYGSDGSATDALNRPNFVDQTTTTDPASLSGGTIIQGICWDGTHYYITKTNGIYKYDASWSLVDSNTNPIGDTGLATVDHCGDPDVHDGYLYIPVEHYDSGTSPATFSTGHICVFDASTLNFVASYSISAQGHEASGIAYCPRDGYLYISSFLDGSKLWRYQTDGTYVGALTLSASISLVQGVVWYRDAFLLASDSGKRTWRVEYDGTCSDNGLYGRAVGEWEGVGKGPDGSILQAYITGGGTRRVGTWYPWDVAKSAGGGASFPDNSRLSATGRTSLSTYTLAATVSFSSFASNRAPVSYQAGTANTRLTIAYRSATPELAIWDQNNSWLSASPVFNPSLNTPNRVHAVYESTTRRRIYIDGALKNTQNTISTVSGSLDRVVMGMRADSTSESHRGEVGFVYLYPGALSADWIAAEYSNLNAPASFYTIGSEHT